MLPVFFGKGDSRARVDAQVLNVEFFAALAKATLNLLLHVKDLLLHA